MKHGPAGLTKRERTLTDALGNRWVVSLVNDSGRRVYIGKGSRKTSWFLTKSFSRAKKFRTRGEASSYSSSYVNPYMDRRFQLEVVSVSTADKNPKRSRLARVMSPAKLAARRRAILKPKKNPVRRKRTLKSAVRQIASALPDRYVIRGKAKGQWYFFTGRSFDSVGAHAAYYVDPDMARKVSRSIRGMLPHGLKSLEIFRV